MFRIKVLRTTDVQGGYHPPKKNLAAARFFYFYASKALITTHIGPWPTA